MCSANSVLPLVPARQPAVSAGREASADPAPAPPEADDHQVRELLLAVHESAAEGDAPGARARSHTRRLWRLLRAAYGDELTGLRNRRGFMRDGSRLLQLAARRRQRALVLFVDVDRLKLVNDSAGHAAGDELLRATAAALRATFRAGDVLGRVGGDEFAVVALATGADAATAMLRRLSQVLLRANRARRAWPIEVSVGVAACMPDRGRDLVSLLACADHLMYLDKRARAARQCPVEADDRVGAARAG